MKIFLINFLFILFVHFSYSQSISLISSTGFTDNRLYERSLTFGSCYSYDFKKIRLSGEFEYNNFKASSEKIFEFDMLDQMQVLCNVTVKTKAYAFNASLAFILRNNEYVAIYLGPKIGVLTFDGIERKYYYDYPGNLSGKVFEYKLDNDLKYNLGINFQTEIKKIVFEKLSIILDFNPKWIYLHRRMDYGSNGFGPSSLLMTSFGIGLKYKIKK